MIDDAACGNLLRKYAEEGYELLEEMDASSYHPQSERNNQRRSARVHQVSHFSPVATQLEALSREIDSVNAGVTTMRLQEIFCDGCGGEHFTKDCLTKNPNYVQNEAPVNHVVIQNRPWNDPYSNTYNLGWRQHPNFSWGGQTARIGYKEDISMIGQLAKIILRRDLGTFQRNTETNPKEQVNAIELRSGETLESEEYAKSHSQEEQVETPKSKSSNSTPAPTTQYRIVISPPFPAALKKAKIDAQFGKLLEVFKKLHSNIPFADALMQMPSYAKFLKDILANKRKLKTTLQ
ncbi:uncharacterized protein [Primulina huaijiensis]|uniref:uncharacterized protein n=1 Tax=Primulina huaijiensis TaxID=1492673 RepID=UPI003CC715C0